LGFPSRYAQEFAEKNLIRDTFHNDLTKANCLKCYRDHIENVKKECPHEKLLVFDVKEGWEPLCKFLNKPVPDVDFPNVNNVDGYNESTDIWKYIGFFGLLLMLGTPLLLLKPRKFVNEI
jgi:hypothetical protein